MKPQFIACFYHAVVRTLRLQVTGDNIHATAVCDSREVNPTIAFLAQLMAGDFQKLIAYALTQLINIVLRGGAFAFLWTKTPEISQWTDGYIKCAPGFTTDVLAKYQH